MDKIEMAGNDDEKVELYVIEQTTIGGVDYFLATESEEGDCDALILKDVSKKEDSDAIFEVVSDDDELVAVSKVFESLMDDISFTTD